MYGTFTYTYTFNIYHNQPHVGEIYLYMDGMGHGDFLLKFHASLAQETHLKMTHYFQWLIPPRGSPCGPLVKMV